MKFTVPCGDPPAANTVARRTTGAPTMAGFGETLIAVCVETSAWTVSPYRGATRADFRIRYSVSSSAAFESTWSMSYFNGKGEDRHDRESDRCRASHPHRGRSGARRRTDSVHDLPETSGWLYVRPAP